MEMTVDTGKGYVPAAENRAEDAPIGLIPVDAVFSPVRRVAYRVEMPASGSGRTMTGWSWMSNRRHDRQTRLRWLHASCRTNSDVY